MKKNKYYVSVQADTIMEMQGDAAYELEIEATPEELSQLRDKFEEKKDADDRAQLRAIIPGIPYHLDKENHIYDEYLIEIYEILYNLGTNETKEHIASMGILKPSKEKSPI